MTPKQEAALRLALEALDGLYLPGELERVNKAIIALREALAEKPAQQEPVAICEYCEKERPVIQAEGKPWVGLEESEWREIDDRHDWTTTQGRIDAAEEIETKLKEKNT